MGRSIKKGLLVARRITGIVNVPSNRRQVGGSRYGVPTHQMRSWHGSLRRQLVPLVLLIK